ncbi:GNAT family N-acetyltransferase [Candidatus Microgenomates bacterium]|nr:GNAT family N-acetyltransferase [Candidatus Microgenomates bacterium]
MIKIISFEDKYLDSMAALFSKVYSDAEGVFSLDFARKRLQNDLESGRDYCFLAVDENGGCLGGIFCKKEVDYDGWSLYIDSVQVDEATQRQGIGRTLMKTAIDKAKETGMVSVSMSVDIGKQFPGDWYERLGFTKTSWVIFAARMGELKLG